jgi:hypothetical protein
VHHREPGNTNTAEAKSAARAACESPTARLLQLQYDRLMVRHLLASVAVLLLTCAPALAQPETAPADPTQPETAKDDHKLTPENAKDNDKLKPETATDTRKPTKREKDADKAKRGVRSNTPPPPPRKPPG